MRENPGRSRPNWPTRTTEGADGMPPFTSWRKSTFSDESDCVEIALTPELAGVRDSKNADGPILSLPATAWQALLTVLR
ncbi:hypothetical protein BU204_34615 [Actinophytocola xanthii]|uniref:DUF397 domain-containing protein n=2 Tax=Actinophytocola xanthii TaxID=1912961 RepID=A0A1Q8C1L8_9PSEU|nr:hypothetical protein BU204_34615 [Actinophytocola xanthii]